MLVYRFAHNLVLLNIMTFLSFISDQARVGVWVLDGDPSHNGLLRFCISEENFAHNLVLLVASMAQPWTIMESLQKWVTVLEDHIRRLKLIPEDKKEYEDSSKWSLY